MEKNRMRRYTFDTFDNWKEALGFFGVIGTLGALAFGVYSLPRLPPGIKDDHITSHGNFQQYKASVYETSGDLQVAVGITDDKNNFYVAGKDFNKDGRFDEIRLVGVPKGNELESLANQTSLNEVVQEVRKQNK
jgi:hypothetical protein